MKVTGMQGVGDQAKFRAIVSAFPGIWTGRVLDVGARSGTLREALPENVRYVGLDMVPPAGILANIEHAPFVDRTFDVVVALDVLEHADDIHQAFAEVCRVARQYVVLVLPNVYEIRLRLKFLFGRRISGKYGLPATRPVDRHRWVFSFSDARRFVHSQGPACGFRVIDEGALASRKALGIQGALAAYLPNLIAPSYMALLQRT